MSMDELIAKVRTGFSSIADHRAVNQRFSLVDLLSAGFAMFSLKDPSLLAFREAYPYRSDNLKRLYGIEKIPGDTALREGLDGVESGHLQDQFSPITALINKGKVYESRKVLDGYTVIAVDGTQHYCSGKTSCEQCMVKGHRGGDKTFYHQLLAAVWVHPEQATVFPVAAEAIVRQDGKAKNDCELNAAKRLIPMIRQAFPEEKLVLTFDALYGNGPLIRQVLEQKMSYIICVKEGFVLVQVQRLREQGQLQEHIWKEKGKKYTARFANQLPLNGQHQDILVNYLECEVEDTRTGKLLFKSSWITDIELCQDNLNESIAVARSRWKIENETFNTLKNQGYHFEHNYGHGEKYLATNFALLTLLAFLIDQIAQHQDSEFQKAMDTFKTKRAFWETVRQVTGQLPVKTFSAVYRYIGGEIIIDFPLLE